ncbi:MAG: alpha-amylase family glycosyl hydrolase [Desulfobacteraceae bacterium]|jgi:1,4-alpha-glucan branching enzyme
MKLLPLEQLGLHELSGNRIRFGLFLPWVSAGDNNALSVKIIHEEDQFIQSVLPKTFPLTHSIHPVYGDFWGGEVTIDEADRLPAESAWGKQGRYVYRFELRSPLIQDSLDWIIDPYAREYGIGRQSAFTLGYEDYNWGTIEETWKTPALQDLIAYEIMLHEFAADLKGAISRLPYLQDLGINCIEVMPVANVDRSVDWGFEPVGPFGPDERFGKRKDLQQFIEAAHEHGIAVMLDMIYGHSGRNFIYERVYNELHYHENPFMGSYARDMFGPSTDYHRELTRDFYFTANYYWLDKYHVDGIRYDCVPNYYEGCMDEGYSNLVYNTYQKVKDTGGAGHWQRFFDNDSINLIQCAEQLEKPIEIVEKTYSNCTWQNETLNAANAVASGRFGNLYNFAMQLGLAGYPAQASHVDDIISKTALQFLENHDHPRFICDFGTNSLYKEVLREGRRDNWYKLQPYVMGLLLGKGIPMLWEGQEIVENYDVPDSGPARIGTLRPVRWERFYDKAGQSMIWLFRKLIKIRKEEMVFRHGTHYFYNDWDNHQSRGLMLFNREYENTWALVALNFSQHNHEVNFSFPFSGDYNEVLQKHDNLPGVNSGNNMTLNIPAYYGKVWIKK